MHAWLPGSANLIRSMYIYSFCPKDIARVITIPS
nr:MAG TPA: Protein of unknown function (DUF3253) [Caudoviricetes sp.]